MVVRVPRSRIEPPVDTPAGPPNTSAPNVTSMPPEGKVLRELQLHEILWGVGWQYCGKGKFARKAKIDV
jgi:hypothetical protein